VPEDEFVPWTAAYFHTEEARDRFLDVVANQQMSEIEVAPMPDDRRGAWVRWRPGSFLGLNDIAYAHGGRILVAATRQRGA